MTATAPMTTAVANRPPAKVEAPHSTPAVTDDALDPRTMSPAHWRRVGFDPTAQPPILRQVREKCLDCCCQQPSEVRLCPSTGCPLWPYRMGTNPFRAPASEAQREAGKRAMASLHAGRDVRPAV